MAKISLSLILFLVIFSCNKKQETNFYWLSSDGKNNEKLDSSLIIYTRTVTINNKQTLTYLSNEKVSYHVMLDGVKKLKTNVKSIDSIRVRLKLDTTIQLNTTKFLVHNYIMCEDSKKGSIEYYWTPTIGIFAVHSSNRPDLTILQSNDIELNKRIYALVKTTVPSFFVYGKFKDLIK